MSEWNIEWQQQQKTQQVFPLIRMIFFTSLKLCIKVK